MIIFLTLVGSYQKYCLLHTAWLANFVNFFPSSLYFSPLFRLRIAFFVVTLTLLLLLLLFFSLFSSLPSIQCFPSSLTKKQKQNEKKNEVPDDCFFLLPLLLILLLAAVAVSYGDCLWKGYPLL